VGNEYAKGNPVEYPAALLQPVGSNGAGGRGLSVGASTQHGARAAFSNTGSHISLVAPGERVLGALSSAAPVAGFQRYALPGSAAGLYGYASGTSFAVPQVAGAAALVWAANPNLSATGVADILKQTATGRGRWTADLGYGVIDAGAAVERAGGGTVQVTPPAAAPLPSLRDLRLTGVQDGRHVHLNWTADNAAAFRLSVRTNKATERVLLAQTKETSATFRVSAGYTYTFRVTSLDATGVTTATSPPFVVRVKR
jgi:subtilisin family serine protease